MPKQDPTTTGKKDVWKSEQEQDSQHQDASKDPSLKKDHSEQQSRQREEAPKHRSE